jgi:hypothetical protein
MSDVEDNIAVGTGGLRGAKRSAFMVDNNCAKRSTNTAVGRLRAGGRGRGGVLAPPIPAVLAMAWANPDQHGRGTVYERFVRDPLGHPQILLPRRNVGTTNPLRPGATQSP